MGKDFGDPVNITAVRMVQFIFWLQQVRGITCEYRGARSYTRAVLRYYRPPGGDPMDALSRVDREDIAKAFNIRRCPRTRPKAAFSRSLARQVISQSLLSQSSTVDNLVAEVLFLYMITGVRPGNI